MAMHAGQWQQEAMEFIHSIPPEVVFNVIVIGAEITVACFVTRTLLTAVARTSGLYHPGHYHRWPRLPWRGPYSLYLKFKLWRERVFHMGKRSTGGFASTLTILSQMYKPGMVILARAYVFGFGWLMPIGLKIQRHLMIFAMTGAGKTTLAESMVSTWRGSVFLIDVEAQITNSLCERDKREWFVFDPFGISVADSICINFIDCVKEAMERDGLEAAVRWSFRIAVAIITTPPGARSPYFYGVSRQYLSGLILHVLTTHPESDHNLPYIRDLIKYGYPVFDGDGNEVTKENESHEFLLRTMLKNPAFEGAVAGAAIAMANASGETGGNVRSTLQEQTQFLDMPEIRRVLRSSSMPLSWLKTRNDVVLSFACELFALREELYGISRLFTNMLAYTFEAVKDKKGQCLTYIDELPSQRYNEVIISMLAAGRKHGQVFCGVAVNVELMRANYPNEYKSFSSEADATIWMGMNNQESAEYLARELGTKTIIEKDRQTGRKSYRQVQVAEPEQLKRFLGPDSNRTIITRAGGRALRGVNEPGYRALPVYRYAPSKEHGETALRRFTRSLFDRPRDLKNTDKTETGFNVSVEEDHTEEQTLPFDNEE